MELLLVLYLLSGVFKSFALLFGISFPIDLTLLFALLTLVNTFIRNFNFHKFSYHLRVERKKTLLLVLDGIYIIIHQFSPVFWYEDVSFLYKFYSVYCHPNE